MLRDRTFRVAVRRFAPFESAIRRQWESFDRLARTGLALVAEAFDLPALPDTLFAADESARGSWDLAFVNTDWVAAAHAARLLVDLAPYLERKPPDSYPHAWMPSLLRLQDVDGFIAGLPYHDGPECLIFRRDLFEDPREKAAYENQFGQPLQPPETWREFHQVARFFHRPLQGLSGVVFAAFPDGHNTVYDFLLQLWTRGGELFAADGSIQIDSAPARDALSFYRALLLDKAAAHPRCRELDSVQSGLAFAAGEAAMMVNWFGFAAMCETEPNCPVKGKVGVTSVPSAPGCATASLNVYWLLSVPASSVHPDIAYAFANHCLSPEMDKLLTLAGGIGCRRSTWLDADVARVAPFFKRLPHLHENARELPRSTDWPALAHLIDRLVIDALDTAEPIPSLLERAQLRARELVQ